MSKASTWADGYRSYAHNPIMFESPDTKVKLCKVAENGTFEFTKDAMRIERLLPHEAVAMARWIIDTFGEEEPQK